MIDISLQLDKNSSTPLYLQIYRQLRPLILNGTLPAGTRLPATRRLAAVHRIARVTVLQAYEQLEEEGFVEGRAGAGTYVAPNLPINGRCWPLPNEPEPFQPTLSHWGTQIVAALPPNNQPHPPLNAPERVCATNFPTELWRRSLYRASSDHDTLLTHHAPIAGYRPLQEALASYLTQQRGVNCQPEQVIVVSGVVQAIDSLARLLLQRGNEVLMETPSHGAIQQLLQAQGAQVYPLPLQAEALAASRARLAFVAPAHSFSGGQPLSHRLALLLWAKERQGIIIEDGTMGDLRCGGRPLTALQGLDKEGHVVYVGDLSKLMFPSLGLGYVVLPVGLQRPFLAAQQLLDNAPSLLTQIAMAEFIHEGHFEAHLRHLRRVSHEHHLTTIETTPC